MLLLEEVYWEVLYVVVSLNVSLFYVGFAAIGICTSVGSSMMWSAITHNNMSPDLKFDLFKNSTLIISHINQYFYCERVGKYVG